MNIKELKCIDNINRITEFKKFPSLGFAWNIIEQNQTGKIFELDGDCILVLQNGPIPFGYISGEITENSINQIMQLVGDMDFPKIYCLPKFHQLFLRNGWSCHLRAEFKSALSLYRKSSEQTLDIKKAENIDDYRQSLFYNKLLDLYDKNESLLLNTPLYIMSDGDNNVSEVISINGFGHAEIGIVTNPNYRSKGYGVQIATFAIEKLLSQGLIPDWSCNADNIASFHTAYKLGFTLEKYYVMLTTKNGNVNSTAIQI